jgi:hypothetical protein
MCLPSIPHRWHLLTKAPKINGELNGVIRRKKREPSREEKGFESSMESAAAAPASAANPAMKEETTMKNHLVHPESAAPLTSQPTTGHMRPSTRGTDHPKVL